MDGDRDDTQNDTKIFLTMEKGDQKLQLRESALFAWIVPAFLAGVGLTLIALRVFLGLKQFEIPGLIGLLLAKTAQSVFTIRFKKALIRGERREGSPGCSLGCSGLALVLGFLLARGEKFDLLWGLIFIFAGSGFLEALLELLLPHSKPPGLALTSAELSLEQARTLEMLDAAELSRLRDRESNSGFRFLILALLALFGLVVYFLLHHP
jgi:hypothetical protein